MPLLPITAADLGKPLSEHVRVQLAAIMLFPKDPKRRNGLYQNFSLQQWQSEAGELEAGSIDLSNRFTRDTLKCRRAFKDGLIAARVLDTVLGMEQRNPGCANLQHAKELAGKPETWIIPQLTEEKNDYPIDKILGARSNETIQVIWTRLRAVAHLWLAFWNNLRSKRAAPVSPGWVPPWPLQLLFPCPPDDLSVFLDIAERILRLASSARPRQSAYLSLSAEKAWRLAPSVALLLPAGQP